MHGSTTRAESYVRQKIHFASHPDIEATITFTDFKNPTPVNAPAAH
ncbi:hypothetical protein ACFYPA_00040 [Streptomyces sp. NPDC005775]